MPKAIWTTEKYQTCLTDMGNLLSRLVPQVQKYERLLMRSLGVSASQGSLLLKILQQPGISMGEAAAHLGVDVSTLTRIAALLIRDSLVNKTPEDQDKRRFGLNLTDLGREKTLVIQQEVRIYYRRLIEELPPGHVREIMESVKLLSVAMEKALA